MSRGPRNPIRDLRAAASLVIVGGAAVTDVVEAMHSTIAAGPVRRRPWPAGPIRTLVYRSIRDITQVVGTGIDLALTPAERLVADSVPGVRRAAVVAALNGVVGDHLAETGNPLAIEMRFCRDGEPLDLDPAALHAAIPNATGKLLVLVHGLCTNDRFWLRNGHDYGEALARDLGYTPVYLYYNTGMHISVNGREFSDMMEHLVRAWPVPVDEITVIGHSMGALVARSACHYAEQSAEQSADRAWRSKLTRLICLGAPHHGAPLERGGNWVQVLAGISRYTAPLAGMGKLRSAGITDLRYGAVVDTHWSRRDRFEHAPDDREPVDLPAGVACYAVAATLSPEGKRRPRGDGLVPVASALGHHPNSRVALAFPSANQHVVTETGHLDLVGSAEVYEVLRDWLAVPA